MGPGVRELTIAQCRPAGAVVARAFLDDAIWSVIVPDRDRRHRALPSLMAAGLRYGLLSGQVAEATPSLRALSLWEPPEYQDRTLPWLRCLPDLGAALRHATPADVRRVFRWMDRWTRIRHSVAPGPHWYLAMLCADPAHQKQGLAARLALHGLARADADGVDSFLETETPQNVRFYAKMGFHVIDQRDDEHLGIPIWRMLRPAGTTTTAMARVVAAHPS